MPTHTLSIDTMASDAWSEACGRPRVAMLVLQATVERFQSLVAHRSQCVSCLSLQNLDAEQ
mgnify:CR=1 FL=1